MQLVVMANPDLWGMAINPAGVNEAMIVYLMETYGLTLEDLQGLDLTNFYTDTDILHRILGLQNENAIKEFSEHYPFLSQMGMQIFNNHSGPFDLDSIGVEHTGSDLVTIYGPFDPLTGDLIISSVDKSHGYPHYITSPTTTIELNVEELTEMAINLTRSLDWHDDEMVFKLRRIRELLDYSAGDMTRRERNILDVIDNMINSQNGLLGMGIPIAINSYDVINLGITMFAPHLTRTPEVETALRQVFDYVQDMRRICEEGVQQFLEDCDLQIERHVEHGLTLPDTDSIHNYNIYYTDNYWTQAVEEAVGRFMNARVTDAKKVHCVLHYYARTILHAAQVFAEADAELSNKLNQHINDINTPSTNTITSSAGTARGRTLARMKPSPNMMRLEYDADNLSGGIDWEKRKAMIDSYDRNIVGMFKKIITKSLEILNEILIVLPRLKKELLTFNEYRDTYIHYNNRGTYDEDYNNYYYDFTSKNSEIEKYNQDIDDYIYAVRRMESILDTNNVAATIPEQFQEQLLQLLFADSEMFDLINLCQQIAAHSSVSALLISQTNSNLSYNTGATIEAIREIGDKLQHMLEIQVSHFERVKV